VLQTYVLQTYHRVTIINDAGSTGYCTTQKYNRRNYVSEAEAMIDIALASDPDIRHHHVVLSQTVFHQRY
jgi:hypothetical protein